MAQTRQPTAEEVNPRNDPNLPMYDPTRGSASAGVDPVRARAEQQYGYLAAFLDHPEIGPILRQAAAEGWTREVLQGRVYQTAWWKKTSAAQREWELLVASDPASANQRRTEKQATVAMLLGQAGVSRDANYIKFVAESALKQGMDDKFLAYMIFHGMKYSGEKPKGVVGQNMNQFQARAAQYGMHISENTAWNWAVRIAAGESTTDAIDVWLREQAQKRMPQFASEFERGLTVDEVMRPYKEQAASLLEISPEDIDMRNPTYWKMVDYTDPSGKRRAMTLAEASSHIKKTAAYDQTDNARREAAELGERLLRTFGRVG